MYQSSGKNNKVIKLNIIASSYVKKKEEKKDGNES
jgi:hypothetical protein